VLSIVEGFPRLLGRYALLTSFGRGGMGEVFLAKQRVGDTARLCVVKTLRGDLVDSREYIGRFKDEAHVVVQLNHAHISQVYEYGVIGAAHFLVMEFIHGVNLRELLQDQLESGGPLDAGLAMFVVSTTLDALGYAHRLRSPTTGEQLRVVHRDVSPANVMVGFEGDVKLIDFGLAESALKQEQTETRAVMGKVGYMSPEQARGEDVDGRCDQFAAAAMLYEALVGDRFYGDWNTHQIWQKVGHGGHVPRHWALVPEPLRPILGRALEADPARRYPDCDAFRDELDELRARLAPRAHKTMLRETLRRLYAARIEAEVQLIARFADVLPPADGTVKAPTSSPSRLWPRPAAGPATEPFLVSPSQPAGLPAQPGRAPGLGPDAFTTLSPAPPAPGPAPTPAPPLSSALSSTPLRSTSAMTSLSASGDSGRAISESSPFEPTMSSRAVVVAAPPSRRALAALAALAAAGVLAVAGGVVVAGRDTAAADAVVVVTPHAGAPDAGAASPGDAGLVDAAGAVDVGEALALDAGQALVVAAAGGTPQAIVHRPAHQAPAPAVVDAGAAAVMVAPPVLPPVAPPAQAPESPPPTAVAPTAASAWADLPTPDVVRAALACPGSPEPVREMLRKDGDDGALRTIALHQLQMHCPRQPAR